MHSLQAEGVAGSAVDLGLDAAGAVLGVAVGDAAGLEGASRGVVGGAVEGNIADGDGASGLGVDRGEGISGAAAVEDSRLNKNVSAHAGVHASDTDGQVVVVVDVDSAESDGGGTGVDVVPVVVSIGDVELALVLAGVAVRVSDKGRLVVVVEEGVGDGNPVRAVVDVKETIVVVLAVVLVRRQVAVVNPDVGGGLDVDGIAVGGLDLGDGKVADDDVGNTLDIQTNARELSTAGTDNGGVGGHLDLGSTRDGALDVDDLGAGSGGSLSELSQSRDSGGGTALATLGTAVLGGVTNGASLGDGGTLGKSVGSTLLNGGSRGGAGNANKGKLEDAGELHFDVGVIKDCKSLWLFEKTVGMCGTGPDTRTNVIKK